MSGVFATMRQTLLSCSSRVAARGRLRLESLKSAARGPAFRGSCIVAMTTTLAASAPALAGDLPHPMPALFTLNRQEMAVLTTASTVSIGWCPAMT
jgi:hypothetical protein